MSFAPLPEESDEREPQVARVINISDDVTFAEDDTAELEPVSGTKKREYDKVALYVLLIALAILGFVFLSIWSVQQTQATNEELIESQESEIVLLREDLKEAQAEQLSVSKAFVAQESELAAINEELAQTKAALEIAVDPEVVQQLETKVEELTTLEAIAADEAARQAELVTQLEVDVEAAKATLVETEAQLDRAQVQEARAEALATQAQIALDGERGLVPTRAEAMFSLLSGVSLKTTTYDIGEVVYELKRPGVWDDETQYFVGFGEIGYVNNLDKVAVEWLDSNVLQLLLPLPVVEPLQEVALVDYQTDTEREQFARIGGRWGDQTQLFVFDVARQKTRDLACADVGALRGAMTQLKQMAYQLGRGHSVNVRWTDNNGVARSTVSNAQLLSNAC